MRRRAADETVSLFPFLAVLLCTMGTLAMIFAIASQNIAPEGTDAESGAAENVADAKTDAVENADESAPLADATLEELEAEASSLAWFLDELNGVKERTETALEKERARLAAAEKSVADLRSDSTVARRRLDALRNENDAENAADAVELREKIAALDAEIERLETETQALREKNADAKRSYAILPYQGQKGVFRRPIYVECNERGVFLQPEGVPFRSSDFLLARYPGNPFDSGLRAAARRFVEQGGETTADGDRVAPYPLLIIRPGGADRYYAAVAALASWGSDFGYEFIDDDQEIAYPEPDPVLAAAVREQTEFSRRRLAAQLTALMSARAATSSYAGAPGFGVGGFGGKFGGSSFAGTNDGPSSLQARLGSQVKLGGDVGPGPGSGPSSANPRTNAPGRGAPSGGGSLDAALAFGSGNPAGNTAAPGLDADATRPVGTLGGTNAGTFAATDGVPLPRYSGDFAQFVRPAPRGADGSPAENAQSAESSQTAPSPQTAPIAIPNVAAQTSQTAEPTPNAQDAQTAQIPPTAQTPSGTTSPFLAQFQETPQTARTTQNAGDPPIDARRALGNTTFGAGATGSSSSGTLAAGSGATSTRVEATAPKKTESDRLSARENPNALRISDELRRPSQQGLERGISVRCSAAALVFPKQPGLRFETTVPLAADATPAGVERELSDAIVLCVKSWGVAGRNMYWSPFLKVEVASDGEERFRELSEFCRTQGLAIVRAD